MPLLEAGGPPLVGRLGSAISFLTTFLTTLRTTGAPTGGELVTKSSPRLGGAVLPLEEMTRLGAPADGGEPMGLSCSVAESGSAAGAATEALVGVLPLSAACLTVAPLGAEASVSDSTTSASALSPVAPSTSASAAVSTAGSWCLAAFLAATFLAAAFLVAAFLVVFGSCSGGCSSRLRPSLCALRRTRSACASTMLEEWLFTPIPNASVNSRVSLLVSPSSRASSYTRIFDGTFWRISLRSVVEFSSAVAPQVVELVSLVRARERSEEARLLEPSDLLGVRVC